MITNINFCESSNSRRDYVKRSTLAAKPIKHDETDGPALGIGFVLI